MKIEQLPPNLLIDELQERLQKLKTIYKNLKAFTPTKISGRLRVSQKGKYTEYYHIVTPEKPNGKYIRKKHSAIACELAQKDYDSKITVLIENEISTLESYLKVASAITELLQVYCPARQQLITPLTLTNEQYAAQWKTISWQGLPFDENTPVYNTIHHEHVRSKSEVLIADALARHNIPYRYEYPLTLKKTQQKDTITLHPDFYCLNVRTRKEFIWEHFGLMDSPEYAQNAATKLNLYAQNKFFPGRNLIISIETKNAPLTPQTIDLLIKEFLK